MSDRLTEIQETLDYFAEKAKSMKGTLLFDFDRPIQRCDQCDYPFGLHDMASLEKLRRCPTHRPGGPQP